MPKINFYNDGRRDNNHRFFQHHIKQYFSHGGTITYLHKYLGPHDQESRNIEGDIDATINSNIKNEASIQDFLLLENRDRKYSKQIYELFGIYNVQDTEFDLRAHGLFLSNDVIYIEFAYHAMIDSLSRKIMPGDVIELPHQRDFDLLDPGSKAINKFYVVTDAQRSAGGYAPNWLSYIWRVKCEPMPDAQEFLDITKKESKNLYFEKMNISVQDAMSNIAKVLNINEEIVNQAKESVPSRNFETSHYYLVPGNEAADYPWIFAGDGIPPNNATLIGSGSHFPEVSNLGDYFLRTDYPLHVLFQKTEFGWEAKELDYRNGSMKMAHRILDEFINNTATDIMTNGEEQKTKVSAYKAVKKIKADL